VNQESARLGRVISRLRQERGLSQELFAELAGVHRTYVSQLERGLKSPTLAVVTKIAEALGFKVSELIRLVEAE
jgi:transcriptional regulator with XRE-family HTH domain